MAVITVQVGGEEKEISGLTRKTTCAEVMEALLKDHVVSKMNEDNVNKQNLVEFIRSYVIMEDWRGCEKALTPQTRILSVWKAWGEEQPNVKFSLKQDKSVGFNHELSEKRDCDCALSHGQPTQNDSDSAQFLSKLSHEQKKRIRRNLMQYQRAVLHQQSKNVIDDNNNSGAQLKYLQHNRNLKLPAIKTSLSLETLPDATNVTVTLSEEQFVDGVITGPLRILRGEPKNTLIHSALEKTLDKEHCTYRRPHHRRRIILPDGSAISDHDLAFFGRSAFDRQLHRNKSKRKSSSDRKSYSNRKEQSRVTKNVKDRRSSHSSQNSTDSTTSSSPPVAILGTETQNRYSGDDADDEKSIMTECGTLLSRQKLAALSSQMRPNIDRLGNATLSTSVANVTDSSTTTCSETSNTSSSSLSGTSSSDTSASSADIYNESFFVKRAAEIAAARANSNEKTKSGPLKLFRMTKPAQSLIGSFKKKKKSSSSSPQTNTQLSVPKDIKSFKHKTVFFATATTKNESVRVEQTNATENNKKSNTTSEIEKPQMKTKAQKETPLEDETNFSAKNSIDDSETRCSEQLQQQILSQQHILNEECKKLNTANSQIEQLEAQIHRLRSQTHGENYVQDTYLSGLHDNHIDTQKQNGGPRLSSISDQIPWISNCDDVNVLEDYLKECDRVINTQMRIEEHKRQAQIILQEVQDEVWKLSNDPQMSPHTRHLTALALGLMPPELDAEISDDEDNVDKSLSVTTGKNTAVASRSQKRRSLPSENDNMEIERSRTELEANLNLSLRFSSELDEVDKLMCNSRHLLQSKGETLLDLVRELAQYPEGIAQELWEEYGELLMAYDAEIALQRYFAACADYDDTNSMQTHEGTVNLEETKRHMMFSDKGVIDPSSPSDNTLHHTLSPSVWVDQHKHHLKQPQCIRTIPPMLQKNKRSQSQSSIVHSLLPSPSPAANYSRNRSSSLTTSLLPMLPVPDYNDSDYEETVQIKNNESNTESHTMISTENVVPVVVLRHNSSCPANLLSLANSVPLRNRFSSMRDSLSTIDDSGNASGGSTNSDCASTDGGRNDSCDGGSRPSSVIIDSQDSAYSSPLFLRDHLQFTYPPQSKPQIEKLSNILPNKVGKSMPVKPPIPIKSSAVKLASALTAENKKQSVNLRKENRLKKLTRRNSAQPERAPPVFVQDPFFRRVSSFGKGGISSFVLPNQNQALSNKLTGSTSQRTSTQRKEAALNQNNAKSNGHKQFITSNLALSNKPNSRQAFKTNTASLQSHDNLQKLNASSTDGVYKIPQTCTSTYENDSDTGLSSLHSTDSFDKLNVTSGETLV